MEKYRVALSEEEREGLTRMVSAGKAAARKLTHARILLLADDSLGDERPDEQIVAALGSSLRTVSRVRQQLVTEGVDVAILRRRQPPRPDKIKIKGDVERRLITLACSDPPVGRCHWTVQLLADELVVLGLVDRIGVETVRQALKKRHQAVDCRVVVHPAGRRCRLRLAHGRRDPDLHAAVRPQIPSGLLRRGVQAVVRRGKEATKGQAGKKGPGGL
jgi:DNA-binding transcriptional LysR family regulator